MSLSKKKVQDQIEIIGEYKSIQIRYQTKLLKMVKLYLNLMKEQ